MQRRKEEALRGATVITISTGTIFRTVLIGLAVVFLYMVRDLVGLFLMALILAVLVDPFAGRLQRAGLPRGLAVAIVYLLGLAMAVGIVVLAAPPVIEELAALWVKFGPLLENTPLAGLQTFLDSGVLSPDWLQVVVSAVQQIGLSGTIPEVGRQAAGAFGAVMSFILVLILAYYLVTEERVIVRGAAFIAPPEYQPFVVRLAARMREKVGGWLRGQLLIMFLIALLDYLALTALGIPYALVLALFGGIMEVVPFLGPNISVVPAAIVAATVSPVHAALVLAAYFVVQQLESTVLTPKIMQKTTGLNPIITILAILIGLQLAGIVGALLAVPVAVAAGVFLREVFRPGMNEDV